jgi:hypothetical protein
MTAELKDSSRHLIQSFDSQFARIHTRSCSLVSLTPFDLVYRPAQQSEGVHILSMGEQLLRSVAAVERTFGGITANLWDDPFEWALPEHLSTSERISEYLEEVEATRRRAFVRFQADADLFKEVLVPAGDTRPLIVLLIETLIKAADYQGRAIATLNLISNGRYPELQL